MVKWDEVRLPISTGGLGVRPIKEVNVALFSKWLWRLGTEGDCPWKNILIQKYRLGNWDWDIHPVSRGGSGMWRAIVACIVKFKDGIKFKVGHGIKVKFWTNSWCNNSTLGVQFLSIYRLSHLPAGNVSDFYSIHNSQIVWDLNIKSNLSDPEFDEISELLHLISCYRIRSSIVDSLVWLFDPTGCFSVKSFFTSNTREIRPVIVNQLFGPPKLLLGLSDFYGLLVWGKS